MIYGVKDKPKFGQMLLFSLQQLLAILAATILVPALINQSYPAMQMSQSAALFGAGVGTLVYQLFTKFKSPVFLGSSFAFIPSMLAACGGAISMSAGYLGLLIGALLAGLVYVVIALIVKFCGVGWINKVMPAVVIGPTVAIIGLSLAGNAIKDAVNYMAQDANANFIMNTNGILCLICAIVTFVTVVICSVYGKKMFKLIPFIIGILAGYLLATVFTLIGTFANVPEMVIIDFGKFQNMQWYPDFAFLSAFSGDYIFADGGTFFTFLGTVAVAYVPVAFVVFAEHLADHKNLSSIIESDLLEDPGLSNTLLGDGVGSIAGAFFGGCPNTTYGESVGCVAITRNASVRTITVTAIMAMAISFLAPVMTFLATIPGCVMGGVCIALYGFIAVSGLKMIQKVDLNDNRNLFVVAVVLISGVGGLSLKFGQIVLTKVACSLLLGIGVNVITNVLCKKKGEEVETTEVAAETVDTAEVAEVAEEAPAEETETAEEGSTDETLQ